MHAQWSHDVDMDAKKANNGHKTNTKQKVKIYSPGN